METIFQFGFSFHGAGIAIPAVRLRNSIQYRVRICYNPSFQDELHSPEN